MRKIVKELNYSDSEYASARNYAQSLYNFPITAQIGKDKVILPFGTRDSITAFKEGKSTIFVGVNSGLEYISLFIWSPEDNSPEQVIFIDSGTLNDGDGIRAGLIDMSPMYIVKYLLKTYA